MPVADDQRGAKWEFVILQTCRGERDRIVYDLFSGLCITGAPSASPISCEPDKLLHHDPPGGNGLCNQTLLGVAIKPGALS